MKHWEQIFKYCSFFFISTLFNTPTFIMTTLTPEKLIINDISSFSSIEIFVDKSSISLSEIDNEKESTFFITISKKDWDELIIFIDKKFENK